jgi:transcriptional regulator with XRE-family HTH domain
MNADYTEERAKKSARYRRAFASQVRRIDLAILVLEMREQAGLSQEELAERVGTTQSVIARLEDAEYKGQSLRMLERIAAACGVGLRLHASKEPAWDREVALV